MKSDSLSDFWPSKIIDQDTNLKLATVAVHIARFSVAVTAAEGRTLKLPIGGFPRARRAWELEWRCWPLARCRPDRLLPGRPRAGKGCAEARGTAARGFLGVPAGRHAVPCFSQNDAAGMLDPGWPGMCALPSWSHHDASRDPSVNTNESGRGLPASRNVRI